MSIPVSLASTYSAFRVIFKVTEIAGPSSRDTAIWLSKEPGGPHNSCGVHSTNGSFISKEFGDGQGCFSNYLATGYWFNFAILKNGGAFPWISTPLESDEISNFQSATVTVSQVIPEGYDLDGDQVPDFEDLCPNTPANEGVNSDGCSDSQLDGGGSAGGTSNSDPDDCVVTTWNSCAESDGSEGTSGSDGGASTGGNGSTGSGSSNYDNACTNIPADVDCRKLFGGDLSGDGLEWVNIADGTVLSIPFMRETATRPLAIRYSGFQMQSDHWFDAWLSEQANGEVLSGNYCDTSNVIAESVLWVNSQSGDGSSNYNYACDLPSGDGLVWLNLKFWNPYTGDLSGYNYLKLEIRDL